MATKCECYDMDCPAHRGRECGVACHAGNMSNGVILYRVDMEDWTGTLFCEPCAEDALRFEAFTSDAPAAGEEGVR